MIISHPILIGMKNVSDKSCIENKNAHFMYNKFFSENCAIYEIMWEIWYSRTGHR
jgi:hypothetical protein